MRLRALAALAVVCAPPLFLLAEEPEPPRVKLNRITSPIKIDADLSDPGWQEATVVETFYEINPGDNVTPPVRTVARIGYDDRFFYASSSAGSRRPSRSTRICPTPVGRRPRSSRRSTRSTRATT